jgi:signal transduction histidine kinase
MPAAVRTAIALPHPKDCVASARRRPWPLEPDSPLSRSLPWLKRRTWILAAAVGVAFAAMAPWPLSAAVLLTVMGLWREHQMRGRLQELALLNRLSRSADPRAGADAAVQQVLQVAQEFFQTRRCALVLTDSRQPINVKSAPTEHQVNVPLTLPRGRAQLHLSSLGPISPRKALFLAEVAEQIASVAQRCDLAERMAHEAAGRVRHRVALDLHDSAIQPYIGLKLAVEALCMQARAGRPLEAGLNQILAMTGRVIEDLRGCRRQISDPNAWAPPLLAEIEHQAQLMMQFHGVHIAVKAGSEPPVNERMRAEVLQMVREGLSNIRRHTQARSGEVQLDCDGNWLALRIANEGLPDACGFTPRSISERAAALGGRVQVRREGDGRTAVHVVIPVGDMATA